MTTRRVVEGARETKFAFASSGVPDGSKAGAKVLQA